MEFFASMSKPLDRPITLVGFAVLTVIFISSMVDMPLSNNLQIRTFNCDYNATGPSVELVGVRLTTQSNIVIGYDSLRDKCDNSELDSCETRVTYSYHTDDHDVRSFVKNVLFDDIYRNGIYGKETIIGGGSSADEHLTSTQYPCLGASLASDMVFGPGNGASSTTTTTSAMQSFGLCQMTCDSFTTRVYDGLSNQIPDDGEAKFLRSTKIIHPTLAVVLIMMFMVYMYTTPAMWKRATLLVILAGIIAITSIQIQLLEQHRKHMNDTHSRTGYSVLIIGVIVTVITFVLAIFTSQEDLKNVMSRTTMEGLL